MPALKVIGVNMGYEMFNDDNTIFSRKYNDCD